MQTDVINVVAQKLNIKTVMVHVENKKTYEQSKEIGVHYCQGYYFGKPSPLESLLTQYVTNMEETA